MWLFKSEMFPYFVYLASSKLKNIMSEIRVFLKSVSTTSLYFKVQTLLLSPLGRPSYRNFSSTDAVLFGLTVKDSLQQSEPHHCSASFKTGSLTFLVVQWLRLCVSSAGSMGFILGWGTKILMTPSTAKKFLKRRADLCPPQANAQTHFLLLTHVSHMSPVTSNQKSAKPRTETWTRPS